VVILVLRCSVGMIADQRCHCGRRWAASFVT
jgi:hypothetical protein